MQALNEKQKSGLWLGIALAVAMGVYPPWQEANGGPGPYAPIYEPPRSIEGHPPVQIDWSRLLLQWSLVGLVSGGLVVSAKEPRAGGAGSQPRAAFPGLQTLGAAPHEIEAQGRPLKKLRFPEKRAIGELLVESEADPEYWDSVAEARGAVDVPEDARLQLEITKDVHVDLSCLVRAEMGTIVSVDASDSKITDEDLISIAALRNLKELDLSNTAITDDGLQKLASLRSLEKLWLDGTKVSDQALSTLKELPNLTKVSLADTEVDDSRIISLKEERSGQCEFVLRNGSSV